MHLAHNVHRDSARIEIRHNHQQSRITAEGCPNTTLNQWRKHAYSNTDGRCAACAIRTDNDGKINRLVSDMAQFAGKTPDTGGCARAMTGPSEPFWMRPATDLASQARGLRYGRRALWWPTWLRSALLVAPARGRTVRYGEGPDHRDRALARPADDRPAHGRVEGHDPAPRAPVRHRHAGVRCAAGPASDARGRSPHPRRHGAGHGARGKRGARSRPMTPCSSRPVPWRCASTVASTRAIATGDLQLHPRGSTSG